MTPIGMRSIPFSLSCAAVAEVCHMCCSDLYQAATWCTRQSHTEHGSEANMTANVGTCSGLWVHWLWQVIQVGQACRLSRIRVLIYYNTILLLLGLWVHNSPWSCAESGLVLQEDNNLWQQCDNRLLSTWRQWAAWATKVEAFLMAWDSSNTTLHQWIWNRGPAIFFLPLPPGRTRSTFKARKVTLQHALLWSLLKKWVTGVAGMSRIHLSSMLACSETTCHVTRQPR